MKFVFSLDAPPAVPVSGTDALFPVHRIYCVARNYADHAREMGADPGREPPFFFTKPADAVVASGSVIPYPMATAHLSHEVELVVAVGRGGAHIAPEAAMDHVYGYAVGLDLTRRDLQLAARDRGHPWDTAKGFDQSAPVSAIRPAAQIGHPGSGTIWLSVNGQPRQQGDLNQMIWPVADIVAHLSRLFVLRPGDLIFTGTPAGVGAVQPGDELVGGVQGVGDIALKIAG